MDLRFDELKFPGNDEKILRVAPGSNFVSVLTESGRCFSKIVDDATLVESGKLKDLRVVNIEAGAQHVLVSAMHRNEDVNGNQELMLNKTYTINFKPIKGLGSGEENYQEPDTGENPRSFDMYENSDKISVIELDGSVRDTGSRATTLECKDTESSGNSSMDKVSPDRSNSTIRFIDNGIEQVQGDPEPGEKVVSIAYLQENIKFMNILEKLRNGSVKIQETDDTDENKTIIRKKTPMPRGRKSKAMEEDLDESGIIDRDEDLYNDDDDVSTSTMHGSDDSLEDYIKEENKINEDKTNDIIENGKMKRWKQFVTEMKDKSKGFSCKNADTVIVENGGNDNEVTVDHRENSKSCSIM